MGQNYVPWFQVGIEYGDVQPVFAGIGQAMKAQKELEQNVSGIRDAMEHLTSEFASRYHRPQFHLMVHRVKNRWYLRWRKRGVNGDQPVVELFSTSEGWEFLGTLSHSVVDSFSQFERMRLDLNYRHSIAVHSLDRVESYIEAMRALKHWAPPSSV